MKRAILVLAASFVVSTLFAPFTAACRARPEPAARAPQTVVWRTVGSWTGRGNAQTESFTSETGTLRVHWQTANEAPEGTGRFRLTVHSAISGRPLEQVVEHRGAGSGIGYINQDPRVFYLVVESDHLSWQLAVDEGMAAQVTGSGRLGCATLTTYIYGRSEPCAL